MGRQYDTVENVLSKFKQKHGDKYDYSRVKYIDSKTKVVIICPIHGRFMMSPNHHNAGRGCKECFKLRKSENQKLSLNDVVAMFIEVHGDFYDYSKFEYINTRTKGVITCPHHGEFSQSERIKISPAYLYQVKLENVDESFTKIGVTVNPKNRFTQFTGYKVTESHIKEYANMELPYNKECELHSKLRKYKYKPLGKFYGSRECYKYLNYCTL